MELHRWCCSKPASKSQTHRLCLSVTMPDLLSTNSWVSKPASCAEVSLFSMRCLFLYYCDAFKCSREFVIPAGATYHPRASAKVLARKDYWWHTLCDGSSERVETALNFPDVWPPVSVFCGGRLMKKEKKLKKLPAHHLLCVFLLLFCLGALAAFNGEHVSTCVYQRCMWNAIWEDLLGHSYWCGCYGGLVDSSSHLPLL